MEDTGRRYLICDKCHGRSHITKWEPGVGLDPEIRQFKCKVCDNKWYQRIPLDEQGEYEKWATDTKVTKK